MRRILTFVAVLWLLCACGGAPAPTGQGVIDAFHAAGLNVTDVKPDPPNPDSKRPNSFKEQLGFTIPEVAPKGGQIFVCDTKKNCDALYAWYDAFKALAGPYTYQSPSGTVVAQLNSGLAPEVAAKYEAVIKALP